MIRPLFLLWLLEFLLLLFGVWFGLFEIRNGWDAEMTKAWVAHRNLPSPETEAQFLRKKQAHELREFTTTCLFFSPLMVNTAFIFIVARRDRLKARARNAQSTVQLAISK